MSARKRPRPRHRPNRARSDRGGRQGVPPVWMSRERFVPEPIPASGSRWVGRAWCVWCDYPVQAGDHDVCRQEMTAGALWVPCVACLGGGVDLDDRGGCEDCGGIGFLPADGPSTVVIDLDGPDPLDLDDDDIEVPDGR